MILSSKQLDDLQGVLSKKYKDKSDLIPCIHECLKMFNCIPLSAQKVIAETLKLSLAKVSGVVSFYDYFKDQTGDTIIEVCVGTSCFVQKSKRILKEVLKITNCKENCSSADGKYTVLVGRCLGRCAKSPNIIVNHKIHNNVSINQLNSLINEDGS